MQVHVVQVAYLSTGLHVAGAHETLAAVRPEGTSFVQVNLVEIEERSRQQLAQNWEYPILVEPVNRLHVTAALLHTALKLIGVHQGRDSISTNLGLPTHLMHMHARRTCQI